MQVKRRLAYLKANSAKEAIEWMGRRFPGEEFIIEIWQ
jgi:hypothetical protein